MKSLSSYIQEKLIIKKSNNNYKYFPKDKNELKDIIEKRLKEGNKVDLNDIDVSKITDMSKLFEDTDFNGNISEWDVSNVTNMSNMFFACKKLESIGDISKWDVSNVTDMRSMFYSCTYFNQDISGWDVSNVTDMSYMFAWCESFNQDLSSWDISKVRSKNDIFNYCSIEEEYKPKFK